MGKLILYGEDARDQLSSGISIISKAVKETLGPSGKNVLIRNSSGENKPFATKDGVTVAGHISSDNPAEQVAIEAVQDVANLSDIKAGDGTTTATILTEAIFNLGVQDSGGFNLLDMKRGIDYATSLVVKELKRLSIPIDGDMKMLKEVALISSNNDEVISDVVVDAFGAAGNQGVVNIKRSRTHDTYLTTILGMNLSTGYMAPYYVNDFANDTANFKGCYIYMTNESISSVTDNLTHLLQACSEAQEPLLIICKDMDIAVSSMIIENVSKGHLRACVCKAPGFGNEQVDELNDLGIVMGKQPFIENSGLLFNELSLEIERSPEGHVVKTNILSFLPKSEGVIVGKNSLSIKGPLGLTDKALQNVNDAKKERTQNLRDSLELHHTSYEKALIQTRISRLSDGIAYINIGAISDMEYDEKQARIQDALYAVKAAANEGVIPGGGTALLHISYLLKELDSKKSESFNKGVSIVYSAIRVPFYQILKNVGLELKEPIVEELSSVFGRGVDARTEIIEDDMIVAGIIDPVMVCRVALESASSIAGMLLTTSCVIIDTSVYDSLTHNDNPMI